MCNVHQKKLLMGNIYTRCDAYVAHVDCVLVPTLASDVAILKI